MKNQKERMYPRFDIFGEVIFTYPLLIGCIFAWAYHYIKLLIQKTHHEIPNFNLYFALGAFSAWAGAKGLFLLTLGEKTREQLIHSESFWLGGGLVFYGGAIAVFLFTLIYAKLTETSLKSYNVLIPALALGHSVGRIACLLAGCCYGTHCDLPWAINLHGALRHPVQAYEAVLLLILGIILHRRLLKNKDVFYTYLGTYSVIRFILEFFRGDKIRGEVFGIISTSQTISLLIVFLIIIYQFFLKAKHKSLD